MERGGRQKCRTAPVAGAGVSINKRGCWIALGDMRKVAKIGIIAGTERHACPIKQPAILSESLDGTYFCGAFFESTISMPSINPQSCIDTADFSIGHDCAATAEANPLTVKAAIVSTVIQSLCISKLQCLLIKRSSMHPSGESCRTLSTTLQEDQTEA